MNTQTHTHMKKKRVQKYLHYDLFVNGLCGLILVELTPLEWWIEHNDLWHINYVQQHNIICNWNVKSSGKSNRTVQQYMIFRTVFISGNCHNHIVFRWNMRRWMVVFKE